MFNPEELAYKEPAKKKFALPRPRVKKPSPPSSKVGLILGSLLLVVGLASVSLLSYQNLQNQFHPKPTTDTKNDAPPQQVLGLIESVENKGTDLPDNEFPTVATVSDLSTLSDQAFFNGAAIGDKVLIYAVAKRAILFRPGTNQIIRESRVELSENPQEASASSSGVLAASDSAEPVLRIRF